MVVAVEVDHAMSIVFSTSGESLSLAVPQEVETMTALSRYDDRPTRMPCCLAMQGLAAKERWESTP